ncbi:hypothetical protein LZ30DRAFT_179593 [Colletotrichum cereale]|nr:hypothetical protein LZ30DRAFT_179593 [Colletotrichum cereale]
MPRFGPFGRSFLFDQKHAWGYPGMLPTYVAAPSWPTYPYYVYYVGRLCTGIPPTSSGTRQEEVRRCLVSPPPPSPHRLPRSGPFCSFIRHRTSYHVCLLAPACSRRGSRRPRGHPRRLKACTLRIPTYLDTILGKAESVRILASRWCTSRARARLTCSKRGGEAAAATRACASAGGACIRHSRRGTAAQQLQTPLLFYILYIFFLSLSLHPLE